MSDIYLKQDMICRTSGVNNNCGLNCLTHFLYAKLKSGEAQLLFSNNSAYQALLETFQEYYALEQKLSLEDLKKLLDDFPSPFDQEVILAPVLRQHLGKILKNSANELYAEAPAAISEYLREGIIAGVSAPLINSNITFFEKLKENYDLECVNINQKPVDSYEREVAAQQLSIKSAAINDANILDQVLFNRENDLMERLERNAKSFWLNEGCDNYADYIGDLSKAVEVSADHLTIMCQELGIGVEVYTQDSIDTAKINNKIGDITHGAQLMPADEFPWLIRVFNSGIHWEYEEPNRSMKDVVEHNLYYRSPSKSQFKVKGYIDSKTRDNIMAVIMDKVDNLSARIPNIPIAAPSTAPLKEIVEEQIEVTLKMPKRSPGLKPIVSPSSLGQKTDSLPLRGLRPGARTPPPKLIEKPQIEIPSASPPPSPRERTKQIPQGRPILAQSRALNHPDSSTTVSARPGPFARTEYQRLYNRFEKNMDKAKKLTNEQLHEATIAQLRIVMQNNKQSLSTDQEAWFKENFAKPIPDSKKPPRM